jgi:hypothetical protein
VGSPQKLELDLPQLRKSLAARQVPRLDEIVSRVTASIEPCESVMGRSQGLPVITDNNMGEEWKLEGPYAAYDRALMHVAALWELRQ